MNTAQGRNRATSIEEVLEQWWGYKEFRPMQREIIESILAGRDTLALMPTGGGKSLTYQVPALVLDGLTIVITPLIALMKDQVDRLRALGIAAVAVHSGMDARKVEIALDNCTYGDVKLLYISRSGATTSAPRICVFRRCDSSSPMPPSSHSQPRQQGSLRAISCATSTSARSISYERASHAPTSRTPCATPRINMSNCCA